jgi:hypothetical protein
MQNVEGVGDFEHYQGVWRMQSLANCAPQGKDATRLTYAVEIRPKVYYYHHHHHHRHYHHHHRHHHHHHHYHYHHHHHHH